MSVAMQEGSTCECTRVAFIGSDRIRRIQNSLKDRLVSGRDFEQAFTQMGCDGQIQENFTSGDGKWDIAYFIPRFSPTDDRGVYIAVSLSGGIGVYTQGKISRDYVDDLLGTFHRSLENHLFT